jgi:hypothetical protein
MLFSEESDPASSVAGGVVALWSGGFGREVSIAVACGERFWLALKLCSIAGCGEGLPGRPVSP